MTDRCRTCQLGTPIGYAPGLMEDLTPADRIALLNAIATREGTAKQIAQWYGHTVPDLRKFVEENREELERVRQHWEATEAEQNIKTITPTELSQLWITNKLARLTRYEQIANLLFEEAAGGSTDATVLRELRSYLAAAANELGQLLHRGAGDAGTGDTLSVDIQGVDLDNLR